MKKLSSLLSAVVLGVMTLGVFPAVSQATVILDVSGGELIGARNVNVGGTFYDVAFGDGTCAEFFSGCDDAASDFTFTDYTSAAAAATALFEQVFLDTVEGLFGSVPSLIRGCEVNTLNFCQAIVPYEIVAPGATNQSTTVVASRTYSNGTAPHLFDSYAYHHQDLTIQSADTWAVFSLVSDPTQINEPSTLLLFGFAMLGLGAVCRRKQKVAGHRDDTVQEVR